MALMTVVAVIGIWPPLYSWVGAVGGVFGGGTFGVDWSVV